MGLPGTYQLQKCLLIRDSQMSQGVSNIVSKIRTYMDSMGVIMGEYDIGGDKLSQIQLIGGIQFMSEKSRTW